MVTNPEILNDFEMAYEKSQSHSFEEKLAIYDSMIELKMKLHSQNQNILDGLEWKIQFIKLIHNVKRIN